MDTVIVQTAKPLSELNQSDIWFMGNDKECCMRESDFGEMYNYFQNIVVDGQIQIYREMKVDEQFFDGLKTGNPHLGIYWSWNPDAAHTYWSDGKSYTVVLNSIIDEQYVDWIRTFQMNHDEPNEKEIRLFKGTPIQIKEIYFKQGQPIDIDQSVYQNTYYA